MKRQSMIIACALGTAFALQAQIPASHIAESKQLFGMVNSNFVALAEKMPDAEYGFKATNDIRTFGQIIAHVADTQAHFCSAASGPQKTVGAGSKTTKADIVAALKASVDICEAAWNGLTPETAAESSGLGFPKGSKLEALEFNTIHTEEEYGYLSVYLRLKGIVPPSSAGRGGGR
ncbi:MAG TPA: DinB family protein [Bryobacteraceae bacterium]|nr:DinB family protein [Bryobacteraceae bacterium]